MPARTLADLPDDLFIRCGKCEYEGGEGWEAICVDAEGNERFDIGWIRLNTQNDPWMVDQSEAGNGWGPFFYDLAMEVATHFSTGMRPHFQNVSDSAYQVWVFYFQNRPDVTHEPLDADAPFAHDAEARPELRFGYSKETAIVAALEAADKLWKPPVG